MEIKEVEEEKVGAREMAKSCIISEEMVTHSVKIASQVSDEIQMRL